MLPHICTVSANIVLLCPRRVTYARKDLFWFVVLEISVHGYLAPLLWV